MFKIYKRTIHIGTSENPQGRLEYQLEESSGSSLSKILAIPAMIAGAVVGTLVFSVFFAVLLIPAGIVGYKVWRLMRTAQQQNLRQGEGDSISAEYTVISDAELDKKSAKSCQKL
jgi:NhaP-type Na+/H+ and K+/H+ antiporter